MRTATARLILLIVSLACLSGAQYAASNDVTWTVMGVNQNDSMPIGNGDLAANVWTETNGDIVLLVAKSDAWTGMGQLVKLGRVRISIMPNPFTSTTNFTQTLRLENGSIEIRAGHNVITVWADANQPVIHVEASLAHAAKLKATLELWRTSHPYNQPSPDKDGLFEFGTHDLPASFAFAADTVAPASGKQVVWYHFNQESVYPLVLQQEHLLEQYPDPLLHRCFGGALSGPGLVSLDDHTLQSRSASHQLRLDLVALTQDPAASPDAWQAGLAALERSVGETPIDDARAASAAWWQAFWNRSWIHVTGSPEAQAVSQGYAMQRYMLAASSRGAYPVKFNGGLFTVGAAGNPDYRQWGNSYWNQNNRLLYWPLLETGDFDLIQPWFDMYLKALPLAEARAQIYDHHAGAAFPETMYFWGLSNISDFGWDNPTDVIQNRYQRYHIQGALEVVAQMLDEYAITGDATFATTHIVPLADAVVTYYDLQWPRGPDGKIRMAPAQSLETYQLTAVDPTPDIAGLMDILPRLLALPPTLTSADQRARWSQELRDLPPIPMGTTANGKTPPLGVGDPNGTPVILPALAYGPTRNSENPELYTVFPYRLYGLDKPDLQLARDTFAARRFPQDTCWGQDGPQAADLGLTAVAEQAAIAEFTDYGDQRFGWFWKAGHDWIPDLDNGGTGMITLEQMLMQTDGKRILLLPAWPQDWTADFKLHAPDQTLVEGHVDHGKITKLKVTPESRAKDVTVVGAGG